MFIHSCFKKSRRPGRGEDRLVEGSLMQAHCVAGYSRKPITSATGSVGIKLVFILSAEE
jgi:hypothetical protein